jgi:putative transposase
MRVGQQRTDDAEEQIQRTADHRGAARAGGGRDDGGGVPAARRVSEQTFYRWKAKYGGMGASDAAKLKGLEDENRRLKKLLAEAMLDVAALKDVLGKN